MRYSDFPFAVYPAYMLAPSSYKATGNPGLTDLRHMRDEESVSLFLLVRVFPELSNLTVLEPHQIHAF